MKYITELSDIINIVNESEIIKEEAIFESENVSVNNIKRFILFDFKNYEKINKFKIKGLKIDYVYSDSFTFDISDDIVHITNIGKKNIIDIAYDEYSTTVIYCKSGYLNENIIYLLNKFIDNKFFVIHNPKDVQVSANKLLTSKLLDENNIRQAKYCIINKDDCDIDADMDKFETTIASIYGNSNEENKYVCKILGGHGGHGVFICNQKNILSVLQCIFTVMPKDYNNPNILVQQKIDFETGDLRAYVLNINGYQEVVECIMRKKSSDDFRTNISLGNSILKYKLNYEQEEFVKRVARKSGLIFAGIDLCIEKDTKNLYVIEINGAPGAPTAINIDEEENREAHEKFYSKIINIIDKNI
ncbi:hypothetical protein IKN40_04950 [bacterium]|nr:hypothetical protein [bacterium]